MTINLQLGDVDARGATIPAQAATPEASIKPSFATRWPQVTSGAGGSGVATSQAIYAHGQKCKQPGATWPKPTAPSALAALNTPSHNDNQYSEPTYMRYTRRDNAVRRH
jgi:hypothetical protein